MNRVSIKATVKSMASTIGGGFVLASVFESLDPGVSPSTRRAHLSCVLSCYRSSNRAHRLSVICSSL